MKRRSLMGRVFILVCFGLLLMGLWPAAARAEVSAYYTIQGESFDVNKSKGVSTSWENDQSVTLGWTHDGDYACYRELNFDQGVSKLRLRLAKIIHDTVQVKACLDSPTGSELVSFSISDAVGSSWTDYEIGSVKISRSISGVHDVYFVFHSLEKEEQLLHIDWFQFVEAQGDDPGFLPPEGLKFKDDLGVTYRVLKGSKTCELYSLPKSARILDTKETVSLTGTYQGGQVQVELPVVKVAANAAKNCSDLEVAYIGGNVTTVGKYAFKGCKKLKVVVFRSNQITTKVKASAFYDIKKKAKIYAPENSLAALKEAFQANKKTKARKFKYYVYQGVG